MEQRIASLCSRSFVEGMCRTSARNLLHVFRIKQYFSLGQNKLDDWIGEFIAVYTLNGISRC